MMPTPKYLKSCKGRKTPIYNIIYLFARERFTIAKVVINFKLKEFFRKKITFHTEIVNKFSKKHYSEP